MEPFEGIMYICLLWVWFKLFNLILNELIKQTFLFLLGLYRIIRVIYKIIKRDGNELQYENLNVMISPLSLKWRSPSFIFSIIE